MSTARGILRSKRVRQDQFEAVRRTQRAYSDPLFKFLQDGKHGIAAGWDDDVQH